MEMFPTQRIIFAKGPTIIVKLMSPLKFNTFFNQLFIVFLNTEILSCTFAVTIFNAFKQTANQPWLSIYDKLLITHAKLSVLLALWNDLWFMDALCRFLISILRSVSIFLFTLQETTYTRGKCCKNCDQTRLAPTQQIPTVAKILTKNPSSFRNSLHGSRWRVKPTVYTIYA